ncbi:MAG: TadE/TadG family type IV pilus assembly protein [Tsuneonella sp.]
MRAAGAALRHAWCSRSGVAAIEFALSAPLFLGAGLWGAELANQAIVQMEISQLAEQVADNASRIGDVSVLEAKKVYESDIDDILRGANLQGGSLDLLEHGRVIISSLETVPGSDSDQYIHWQRCKGAKVYGSSYGLAGAGSDGGMVGMGPEGEEIAAPPGDAVMFVEIAYDYQPLIGSTFTRARTLYATAAFNVRDSRDLSGIYQRDPSAPAWVADCDTFDSFDHS